MSAWASSRWQYCGRVSVREPIKGGMGAASIVELNHHNTPRPDVSARCPWFAKVDFGTSVGNRCYLPVGRFGDYTKPISKTMSLGAELPLNPRLPVRAREREKRTYLRRNQLVLR